MIQAPVPRSPAPPTKRPTAPAPMQQPAPQAAVRTARKFAFGEIAASTAQRIGIYGPGGIGKTSLACRAPGPVALFDFDSSLPVLKPTLGGLDIKVVEDVHTWQDLREALHAKDMWGSIRTIVIDSLTRAEQLGIAHTVQNVRHEKGGTVTSIEGYGFGKGYKHVYETMLALLGDLDQHVRDGRNVILIAHDCTANVPNPEGEDYIRWEPRLQANSNGNFRLAVKEWLDHLLCVRFDVAVKEDSKDRGKASGSGTRTIYPVEQAVHMAKSRSLREPLIYEDGNTEVWQKLFPA